jgi:hypothetical protein
MDLRTITEKLRDSTYDSKAEFAADLNLIWDNCIKYNAESRRPIRGMENQIANLMRNSARKLVGLIPDIPFRSRAEVEAEERRKHNAMYSVTDETDDTNDDYDEPIMTNPRPEKNIGRTISFGPGQNALFGTEGTHGMDRFAIQTEHSSLSETFDYLWLGDFHDDKSRVCI